MGSLNNTGSISEESVMQLWDTYSQQLTESLEVCLLYAESPVVIKMLSYFDSEELNRLTNVFVYKIRIFCFPPKRPYPNQITL